MATTKRRLSSPSAVAKTALEQATLALSELPEKPRDVWSLKEAVEFMQESITAALDRGYSYEEVAEMLNQSGVDIRAASLKYYLTAIKRNQEVAAKPKVGRPRKTKAEKAAASVSAAATTTSPGKPASSQEVAAEVPAEVSLNGATPKSEAEPATPAKKRPRSTTGTRAKADAAKTKTAAKTKPTTGAKSRTAAKPKAASTKTARTTKASSTKATKAAPTRRRKKLDASPE